MASDSGTPAPAATNATERYRAVVRSLPANPDLTPVPSKRYRAGPRWPLPGYAAGGGGGQLALLAALFRPYAPARLHYASVAGALAMLGTASGIELEPWCHELQVAGLRRTVPSGGAYYPVELYAAVPDGPGLPAGVYHYHPLDHAAEQVRSGEPGPALRRAVPGADPAGALLLAGRAWKNAGKYGNLCYHLTALDTGVVLGQVLAEPPVPLRIAYYFLDGELDRLLGLTPELETVLVAVWLADLDGTVPERGGRLAAPAAATGLDPDRRYRAAVDPAVVELAAASRISDPAELPTQPVVVPRESAAVTADRFPLPPPVPPPTDRVAGRYSAVCFRPRPVELAQLATVLAEATRAYPSDVAGTAEGDPPIGLYCVAAGAVGVTGLADGAYRYHPVEHALEVRRTGLAGPALRVAITGLDPQLIFASVSLFLVARYQESARSAAAERWYRVANLLAGVMLLRICRTAAGLGLASRPNLGFQPAALADLLRLGPDQAPLVHVMVGHPAPRPGCLDLWLPDPDGGPSSR